jgi:DNA adenine methylase
MESRDSGQNDAAPASADPIAPLEAVRPVKPVAPYIGGKRNLADQLADMISEVDHDTYAEPFIGMGGVFFRRKRRPRCEVINDISRDVVNLFRILNRHYPQFMDALKFQITSRADFERLLATEPANLTDLERAARFLYLQRTAFGGKVTGRSFGVSPGTSARFDVNRLGVLLEEVHDRLSGVVIECLHWSELIERWDRRSALFYLDPPYWDCETDYGAGVFSKADFEHLACRLATIKGRFILSINDAPEIRRIFAGFHMSEVETTYSIAEQGAHSVRELVFTNIDPAAKRQRMLV